MNPTTTDTWLVIGPGRTGSKVIVDMLCKLYLQQNLDLRIHRADAPIIEIENLTIYHSHDIGELEIASRVQRCVLSTRDIVESALSWCIQPHIGEWHLYPRKHKALREQLEQHIPSFYLDIGLFETYYRQVTYFYTEADKHDLSKFTVIEYSEFAHNQYAILDRLGYVNTLPISGVPTKNPGTYSEWITNWDDIQTVVSKLERNPIAFCKQLER